MPPPFAATPGAITPNAALPGVADGGLAEREKLEVRHRKAIAAAFGELLRRIVPPGTRPDTITPELALQRYHEHAGVLRDALIMLLQEAVLAGAAVGRRQVEALLGVGPRTNAQARRRRNWHVQTATRLGLAERYNEVRIVATDWDLVNQAVLAWVLGGRGDFATGYGDTLAAALAHSSEGLIRTQIAEWIENGLPLAALITGLEATVFSRERAELIAVTEVTRAYAQGNVEAWRASGIIERRQWQTAADELVCPICGPLQGQVRGLDEEFDGGHSGPPAHPRCRCWLSPVVADVASAVTGPAAPWPATPVLQPDGIPVSAALQLPKRSKITPRLQAGVAAIDQTHGDGQLPDLPVKSGPIAGAHGYFAQTWQGVPVEIKVNPHGEHVEMTVIHEVGHFLDYAGLRIDQEILQAALGGQSMSAELQGWLDTIDQSEAVRTLTDYRYWNRKLIVDIGGRTVETYADPGYMKYLLGRDELWARSYAQYVTVRSGDVTLRTQLDKMRENIYPVQWEDPDFAPIAAAIDALFLKRGWLR